MQDVAYEQEQRARQLHLSLSLLDERSRRAIQRRFLDPDYITLNDLAVELGITRERIRQIEEIALEVLRGVITGHDRRKEWHKLEAACAQ